MRLVASLIATVLVGAAVAAQGSPAMIARTGAPDQAEAAFQRFAEGWISKAVARGERASDAPRAREGSAGMVFTYQAVDQAFETELRPTGRPASPYVGVLRYTEHTYTCADVQGSDCKVTSSLPVTEVFRFRDGRWGY
ncbi:MAG: hypothetical protein ACQGVC_02630 [Myxococcota bacterium]